MRKSVLSSLICCSLSVLFLVGCGHSQEAAPAAAVAVEEAPVQATPVTETNNSAKYDHMIEVDGVEIGLKDIEGYKPYVIHFSYFDGKDNDGNCTHGNAYFQDPSKKVLTLDEAKEKDIIADYEVFESDEMLVLYVNENKNGLSLLPAPSPSTLRLEFEDDLHTYTVLWSDAAVAKIGLGKEYKTVDISPNSDFADDDIVCVKNVKYNDYFYGAMGSNVGRYYLFIVNVYEEEYTTIK